MATMQHLILTDYFAGSDSALTAAAPAAVEGALDVAAARVGAESSRATKTAQIGDAMHVVDGVDELVGTTVTWDVDSDLVTLSVDVPWTGDETASRRSLAAAVFTTELSERLSRAAAN